MTATSNLDAALELAALGYRVFPLAVGQKTPLIKGGCGCLDATTDPKMITAWWKGSPRAGVGVATGDGLLVVDVDGVWEAPGEAWTRLVNDAGLNGAGGLRTPCVWSGSGRSAHWWFRLPAGVTLGNSTGRLAAGIDTRGQGGYVVAPPSMHPSGGRYEWVMHPRDVPLVELPPMFVEMLEPQPRAPLPRLAPPLTTGQVTREGKQRMLGIVRRVETAAKGERHDVVFWAACRIGGLVATNHVAADLAVAALRAAVDAYGLTPRELAAAERTIRDGMATGGSG